MDFNFLKILTVEQQIIIAVFAIFFLIQLFYYCIIFARVAFYRYKSNTNLNSVSQEGISVIVCARNESEILNKFLPLILNQGHPKFEVILVNNCSTDDSPEILTLLQAEYKHLVVRTIDLDDVFAHNQSMAWGVGIKAAQYEWIVLTDIYCLPENENWLASLHQNFNSKTDVVLSYTHIMRNKLVRADNFRDALYYLSKACCGKVYTGSGNNLAFRKNLFFENKGFHPQITLRDKADRIFINTVANKENTAVDLSFDAINSTSLNLSFEAWKLKRRDDIRSQRLFRKGTRYKGWLEPISRVFYYITFIVALIFSLNAEWAWITILSLFAARSLIQLLIFAKAQKRLKEKGLLLTSLLWDIISPIVYIPIVIASRKERR